MAISRWDPFAEMTSLRGAMDRFLEDVWMRPWGWRSTERPEMGMVWAPIDLYETDEQLVVTASLPGVKPEDIDVSVDGNTLRIQAEMKEEREAKAHEYYRRERQVGRFFREIALPAHVKSENVQARFENGILRLHLPKAEEARARRIPIQAGAAPAQIESRAA